MRSRGGGGGGKEEGRRRRRSGEDEEGEENYSEKSILGIFPHDNISKEEDEKNRQTATKMKKNITD